MMMNNFHRVHFQRRVLAGDEVVVVENREKMWKVRCENGDVCLVPNVSVQLLPTDVNALRAVLL